MNMMLRGIFLLQMSLSALAQPSSIHAKFAAGLKDGGIPPGQQNQPCILYEKVIEYEGGKDGSEWVCEFYGIVDGSMYATLSIVGMEHVLKAKPNIESGRTTLFAKGAKFTKDNVFDHRTPPWLSELKLFITSGNELIFGEADNSSDDSSRRKLSSPTGDLSVLVVRVAGADKSIAKTKAIISGDWFGTDGDQINLKSNAETCSNNLVTINPISETGSGCQDDQNAIFDVPYDDGNTYTFDCHWFNYYLISTPGDLCGEYGSNSPMIGDPNETPNTRCCICGGGDTVPYVASDGVMDLQLTVNVVGNDIKQLEFRAMRKLLNLFAVNNLSEKFDHVMICVPSGSLSEGQNNWAAYAYVPGTLSVYNGGNICASEHDQMHEIGHNWGLRHAKEGSDEYGDDTGYMGGIGQRAADDAIVQNKMCYNGAHSWQLGWYTPYNLEINPLTTNFAGTLVGVDKVPNLTPSQEPYLVLKLSNPVEDYYIIYNHAVGQNAGTAEAANQVTITTKATGDAKSFLVAKLTAGTHRTFSGWGGSQDSVTVYVASIDTAAGSGNAVVEVWKGLIGDQPAPPAPTTSLSPTNGPTSAPTHLPSSSPSSMPSSLPSPAPSAVPTPSPPPTSGPTSAPTRTCVASGGSCSANNDCCSGNCKGGRNKKTCQAVEGGEDPAPAPSPPSPTPPSPTGVTCSTSTCSTDGDCCSNRCNNKNGRCKNRRLRANTMTPPTFMMN